MPETVVFENVLLIDCTGKEPVPGTTVVVAESRIKKIGKTGKVRRPKGATVIDLQGSTLMPGLTDAHVHLAIVDVDLSTMTSQSAAVFAFKIGKLLENTLNSGFTTVRDAGGLDFGFKEAVEQGLVKGPRLLISNSIISQTGGHGDFRRRTQLRPLEDRSGIGAVPAICDGVDEVRKAARDQLRRGADQVKVMACGGAMSPTDELDSTQYTVEELAAAVYEAKAVGKITMAHTYTPHSIRNCLQAGIVSIEHGNFLDEETAEMMHDQGAFLVPTLTTYELIASMGVNFGVPEDNLRKTRQARDRGDASVEIALGKGVKIGSGSDLLGPMHPFKAMELELKARIIGPMDALVSATKTNAELFGLADQIGTVEEGKLADLIVVKGNPLEDISLLKDPGNIAMVMKEGQIVKDEL